MVSEVYRQNAAQRVLLYVVFCFMALIGAPMWIAALVSGDGGLFAFMTLWVGILAFNGYRFLGGPRQIEVTPACIRFVGWRTREVPRSSSRTWVDDPATTVEAGDRCARWWPFLPMCARFRRLRDALGCTVRS
jgi:hypothetical protein